MSCFFSDKFRALTPYVPGEQPKGGVRIKLNTNESPFPPSPRVLEALDRAECEKLNLYSDPTASELLTAIANRYGVPVECVFAGNGSDEVLAFAFDAFCDDSRPAVCPEISYGFYPVFAGFFRLPYRPIPLAEDLSIRLADYRNEKGTVILANPNAQTGTYLTPAEIEALVAEDPGRVVIVDEAYIDFGGESAVPLTQKYRNLLVVSTFSKSRNLAGARIGYAIGDAALIADLNTLKYAFNPYNLNRLSLLAGKAAMEDEAYFRACTQEIVRVREWTAAKLAELGFTMTRSLANFLLVHHPEMEGEKLYRRLRERGILVRHLSDAALQPYNRITIGNAEQMQELVEEIRDILSKK